MVNNRQVKRLWRLTQKLSLETAAAKSGMDSKTARKYLRDRRLPSEMRPKHTWRTRLDPYGSSRVRQVCFGRISLGNRRSRRYFRAVFESIPDFAAAVSSDNFCVSRQSRFTCRLFTIQVVSDLYRFRSSIAREF